MDTGIDILTGIQILQQTPHNTIPATEARHLRRASIALLIAFDVPQDTMQKNWAYRLESSAVPRVLIIQRAVRIGDRWSGHLALPGGRREPEDESDIMTAYRETYEEVGIDIELEQGFYAGALDERIITTNWGSKNLMVLCPFVFILPRTPPIHIQESEVLAAKWVPLSHLVDPANQTFISADCSSALAAQTSRFLQPFFKLAVGKLQHPGIKIDLYNKIQPDTPSSNTPVLWGITHTLFVDLFMFFSPDCAKDCLIWQLPRFQQPDYRLLSLLASFIWYKRHQKHYPQGNWVYKSLRSYYKYLRACVILGLLFRLCLFSFFIYLVYLARH
ncbi:nudix family hydrolase [Schizosaccharomyces japonicus yFS275]|uniref:Nudix family hydrolase n=1 Tax=Schizosaccharomyces japonicus (strain yFS275 / FY16936) TaxID=402676 RepID=B6K490_SCHJY|nr:nudix family hydrolase [Schizosaccharomyces japonicus yFS275]EEB08297.1 nudix family hydrolase [Schizosaccharomyces japonicus yFS275]